MGLLVFDILKYYYKIGLRGWGGGVKPLSTICGYKLSFFNPSLSVLSAASISVFNLTSSQSTNHYEAIAVVSVASQDFRCWIVWLDSICNPALLWQPNPLKKNKVHGSYFTVPLECFQLTHLLLISLKHSHPNILWNTSIPKP